MVEEIKDRNGAPLKEGLYWDETRVSSIYFTGKYDDNDFALFESQDGNIPIDSDFARENLCYIRDQKWYAENRRKEADWIQKLNKLGDTTLDLPISLPIDFMLDQGNHRPFGKNPYKHDDGRTHPNKRY